MSIKSVFHWAGRLSAWLDRWSWLWLLLAGPFYLFPSPRFSPVLLCVPLLLLAQKCAPGVTGMVLGLGVFYTVVRYGQSPKGWWLGLAFFAAVGLGLAGVALLGMRWSAKFAVLAALTDRLPHFLLGVPGIDDGLNSNEVAGALLWVIPGLAALAVEGVARAREWRKALGEKRAALVTGLLVGAALFVLAVFVLAQSRSAYLALGLAGPLLVWLAVPPRRRGAALAGLVIAGGAGGLALWQTGTAARLFAYPALSGEAGVSIESLPGRLEIWSRAVYAIEDFSFTGIGMNTFQPTVNLLYPLFLFSASPGVTHAHNEFLQAALDLGLPGLIAFVALYAGVFGMVVKIGQGEKVMAGVRPRTLALGLGGGLLAHGLYGFTDSIDLGLKYGILFWLLLGLIAALYRQTVSGRQTDGKVH